jgi:hypothetical protein
MLLNILEILSIPAALFINIFELRAEKNFKLRVGHGFIATVRGRFPVVPLGQCHCSMLLFRYPPLYAPLFLRKFYA